jgi:hypothetical protein
MDRIAISYRQACMRLAIYGLSNKQAIAAMHDCPAAGRFDGAPYFYPDDIDAMADSYIDGLSIDDCGEE